MKAVIKESWMKACGIDATHRTFDIIGDPKSNLIGRRGFDAFYKVDRDGQAWTVAAARIEKII